VIERTWWRAYCRIVDTKKVQDLPAPLFRHWINMMCIAKRHGGKLPPIQQYAWDARLSVSAVEKVWRELREAKLLEEKDGVMVPHDWEEMQYAVTPEAERQARYRERHKRVTVTDELSETNTESYGDKSVIARGRASDSVSVSVSDSVEAIPLVAFKKKQPDRFEELWCAATEWAGKTYTDRQKANTLQIWLSLRDRDDQDQAIAAYLQQIQERPSNRIEAPWNFLDGGIWRLPQNGRMAPPPVKLTKGDEAQAEAVARFERSKR
jgi:DNA-binding transcriptional regulator YhcF (GntR family)